MYCESKLKSWGKGESMIPYVTKGVAILKRCVLLHKGKREMNAIGVMLFLNGPLLFISFVSSKEITDNCALRIYSYKSLVTGYVHI